MDTYLEVNTVVLKHNMTIDLIDIAWKWQYIRPK